MKLKLFLFTLVTIITTSLFAMDWWEEMDLKTRKEQRREARQEREQSATVQLINWFNKTPNITWQQPQDEFFRQVANLLNKGANPNALISMNYTNPDFDVNTGDQLPLLEYSIILGYPEIVRMLLEHGANARKMQGPTALQLATLAHENKPSLLQKRSEIISLLLEYGANPNQTIRYGDGQNVPLLLRVLSDARSSDNPQIRIIYNKIAKKLIEYGANVRVNENNVIWGFGTPLFEALDLEIVSMILDLGANPDVLIWNRETALNDAIKNGFLSKADMLLDHNSNVNLSNTDGNTPLQFSTSYGNSSARLLKIILAGANVNAQDNLGNTALMSAVAHNKLEMLKLLLENGADSSIRNNENQTALDWAITNNVDKKIIDLLKNPPPLNRARLLEPRTESEHRLFTDLEQQASESQKASQEYKEQAKKLAKEHVERLKKLKEQEPE